MAKKGTRDTLKYKSNVAEIIESGGNFVNNVKNPWFVLLLVCMIGSGFLLNKGIDKLSDFSHSVDRLTSKLDGLTGSISDETSKHTEEINALHDIERSLNSENKG